VVRFSGAQRARPVRHARRTLAERRGDGVAL